MNERRALATFVLAALWVLVAGGCDLEDPVEWNPQSGVEPLADDVSATPDESAATTVADEGAEPDLVARTEMGAYETLFFETPDGELIATSIGPESGVHPLEVFDGTDMPMPLIYETLSGEGAPVELVDAAIRAGQYDQPYTGGSIDLHARLAELEARANTAALTGNQFIARRCPGNDLCVVNQTANRSFGLPRARHAFAFVHAEQGFVRVRLRIKRRRRENTIAGPFFLPEDFSVFATGTRRNAIARNWNIVVDQVEFGDRYHVTGRTVRAGAVGGFGIPENTPRPDSEL